MITRFRVADGVPLTLKAVTLHNVPSSGRLFPQPGSVDHPAAEHCRGTSSLHIPQAAKTTQDVVYIYENIKPDVPGISSQRERTLDNAPEGATYAYITATNSSGAAFNYVIFLGQNDTDNFSVRRNTSTVFQISIEGTSELDYRVSQVQVAATRHTDKYIDLQKYPTQEYAPVLGQYRFSSASAYDPLPGNCYATFTWRNGSDFPVACSTDNGRTRQPYTPGTELLLTAAGDYSVIFYGAWEKGDIPALGSDLSLVELRYGPGRTLLKSYAQQRCIGYSVAFTHVGIPDNLVDWNLTELDTNDGIDRTSTGSTSLPPKFFVFTSTAMSFVEILYDESYPIQGLYANGVRLDIPEDGASMETNYLTPDIPVSTFYKALGGSGVISARFVFQKYKNPVYLTVDRYDFAAIRVQIDGEYDVETNEELQQDIYTMEAGTQVTTRIEILDPASDEADRYIGIASTPVGGAEKVICEYLPATFPLERDTRLSAKLCRLVALDARGTFANCYIISEGYTRYTFNAQYGGSPDNWLPTATVRLAWANASMMTDTDPYPYGWRVATMNQILGSERYYRRPADQLLYPRDTYLPCFGAIYNVGLNIYVTGSTTVSDRLMFGSYLTRSSRVFAGAIDSDASIGALHPAGAQEPLAGMVRCVQEN